MKPHCEQSRERLAAECSSTRPWSAPLEDHLRECEDCAAFAGRLGVHIRFLGELETVGAPADLLGRVEMGFESSFRKDRLVDHLRSMSPMAAPERLTGRVVAACQTGFQEDRAVDHLMEMTAPSAPVELDSRLNDLFAELREEKVLEGPGAPEQLESRVADELVDLSQAISRRALDKLPRLEAPEELRGMVASELTPVQPILRLLRKPMLVISGVAAAAALLMIANLQGVDPQHPEALEPALAQLQGPQAGEPLSFEVEHPESLAAFSPSARAFALQVANVLDDPVLGSQRIDLGQAEIAPRETSQGPATADGASGPGSTGGTSNFSSGGNSPSAGPGGSGASGSTTTSGAGGGPAYFPGIAQAPFSLSYRGLREVTSQSYYQGQPTLLIYTEEVASDGQGQFTIQPSNVIAPVMDSYEEEEFLLSQESRQAFFFKHRDFRIRDFTNFWENYRVVDLAVSLVVAGRSCDNLRIERLNGTGDHYVVAIDPATSLVLREERVRPDGSLISRVEFTTLDLAVDLSDLQLASTTSVWTSSSQSALEALLVSPLVLPVAPPSGFELQDLAYRANTGMTGQETWAQLTYCDGVETAFFMFRDQVLGHGSAGPQNNAGAMENNVVRAMTIGPWSIVDGRVDGREVLAVGRVSESELLLMLQSAFE